MTNTPHKIKSSNTMSFTPTDEWRMYSVIFIVLIFFVGKDSTKIKGGPEKNVVLVGA